MAVFYLDFEGGNDANNGTSFAQRWKTITSGATAARIAPGDEIRIMGSPAPTSLGVNGTWTAGAFSSTISISSSTQTPITVTTATAHNLVVGDTVAIVNHSTNTKANGVWKVGSVGSSTTITLHDAAGNTVSGNGTGAATGTLQKMTNNVVTLSSALTQNIACYGNQGASGGAWTASANVTTTLDTSTTKEGGEAMQIAVGASFTTGLAAYFATGTLNLSGYQQVSFWIRQTNGTLGAAGAVKLALCTDTAGVTIVHNIPIPALGSVNVWQPITVDLGGALNSAIKSIAFYVVTDNGAQTFILSNIIACKSSSSADSLTLTSLIGKNTAGETWYPIQSINGTRVVLDGVGNDNQSRALTQARGYSGTTETVTTYKRETIKFASMGTTTLTPLQSTNDAGTAGNQIVYSGGWNRTDMSTQDGETWVDGQNGYGYGISVGHAYTTVDKINFVRCSRGVSVTVTGFVIGSLSAVGLGGQAANVSGGTCTVGTFSSELCPSSSFPAGTVIDTVARANGGTSNGLAVPVRAVIGTVTMANNNASAGVSVGQDSSIGTITSASYNGAAGVTCGINGSIRAIIGSVTANYNTTYGIEFLNSENCKILGGSTTGNTTAGVRQAQQMSYLRNFTVNEATPYSIGTNVNATVCAEKEAGVANSHAIYSDGVSIVSATDQRHTASGIAWKFRLTSTTRNATYPAKLSVGKVAVAANALVTMAIWVRRDSTDIQGLLYVPGNQLAGIGTTDVSVSCAPSTNTWTQYTLTFTPTEAGVVEVFFKAWDGVGTTNNLWIDDFTVTQA